jgi:uncharacterized protein
MLDDSVNLDESQLIEDAGFFVEELHYTVNLVKDGNQVKAKGNLRTIVSLQCVRCLQNYDFKIRSKFDIILFPANLIETGNISLDEDDMEYIFFEGNRIDLIKILIEQVNLSIPYNPLCSEDCKGLCSQCGVNLNEETCECENSLNEVSFLFNKLKR